MSRVFEPLIADWQREWIDASHAERTWIRIRGTAASLVAVISLLPRLILLTPSPPSTTRRVFARIIVTGVMSTMQLIPPSSYCKLHHLESWKAAAPFR